MSSVPGADNLSDPSNSKRTGPRSWFAVSLAMIALLLMFWGFSFLDLPVIRFIRSLQNHVGIPENLWLVRWSDWGDWIGKGEVLFAVSGLLLLVGFIVKRQSLRAAGIESAVAHAVAGLLGLAIKYVIGRPRPKFMHGEEWAMAPSLESGMHSFPSGHSYASFAVAVALATHFPRIRWMVYGLAGLITISRVVRGAHFPSDVAVGMAFGMLVGALVSNPMGNRWQSAKDMLGKAAMGIGVLFSIVWVATHVPQPEVWRTLMRNVGILLVVSGVGIRIARLYGFLPPGLLVSSLHVGVVLMGLGLVISTGSYVVMLVGTLLVMTQVLNKTGPTVPEIQRAEKTHGTGWQLASECLVGVTCVAACLFLQGITGIVPFF